MALDFHGSIIPLPTNVFLTVVRHLWLLYTAKTSPVLDSDQHFCSLSHPCRVAFSAVFAPILSLRLVSTSWNAAVLAVFPSLALKKATELARDDIFFKRVENAYYPHAWHINTKVRKQALLRRFRVYRTITSESGDRGVYLAYDFGSSDLGCLQANTVIVKAWSASDDSECVTERTVYDVLQGSSVAGIPDVLMSAYDPDCGVYAIVLQRLGPTVDDVVQALPDKKLDEKMVLAVAIQMANIHARGVIHNGMKPANMCLPLSSPPGSDSSRHHHDSSTLYAVDFGLSSLLCAHEKLPGGRKADTVGNRCFMSVFGHHGITQSQRDDLESLAYLLSFLSHGHLPWAPPPVLVQPRIKGKAIPQPQPQLWRIKMSTPASILFQGMDSSFVDFWKDVKGLAFGESPDYDAMTQRFERCWERRSYGGRPGELDWGAVADGVGLGRHG